MPPTDHLYSFDAPWVKRNQQLSRKREEGRVEDRGGRGKNKVKNSAGLKRIIFIVTPPPQIDPEFYAQSRPSSESCRGGRS
jgi:hypothetical protein